MFECNFGNNVSLKILPAVECLNEILSTISYPDFELTFPIPNNIKNQECPDKII